MIADGADAGAQRRQEALGQGTLLRSGGFQLRQLFDPSGRNNRLTYLKVQVGIVAAWVAVSITSIWSPDVGHLGYLTGLAVIVILFVPLSLDEPCQPNQAPPWSGTHEMVALVALVPLLSMVFPLHLLFAPDDTRVVRKWE